MSVRSNGESSTAPRYTSGTVTIPAGAIWDPTSLNFKASAGGSVTYDWIDVLFSGEINFYGTASATSSIKEFKDPIINVTIKGITALGLIPRISNPAGASNYTSKQGFRLGLYNPSGAQVTLAYDLIVQWVAVENKK